MERTLLREASLDRPVPPRPVLVASLVMDSAVPVACRPLVHLARVATDGAPGAEPRFTLGVARSEDTIWNAVGRLDLRGHSLERVLMAGLSVLAMTYIRAAEVQLGDPVVVCGGGPWSWLLVQWARLQGASPLVTIGEGPQPPGHDASPSGIDAQFWQPTMGDLARAMKLTHRAAGFAVAVDGTASEQSMTHALHVLRDGGRYVLAGIDAAPSVSLNAYPDLHRRDLQIVSPAPPTERQFADLFRFSLDLAAQGRLRLEGLLDAAPGWRVTLAEEAR